MNAKAKTKAKSDTRYAKLIESVFLSNWTEGATSVAFTKSEFDTAAKTLSIKIPKNTADVVYSFRYRNPLPAAVIAKCPKDKEWLIIGAGKGKYEFRPFSFSRIVPRKDLLAIKVPDATPEVISAYALSDEQALLAKVRYNRLIDIFLGVTAYSLQNHLRTTVEGMGQIEIDEVYVGISKKGTQYIIPVQAKGGDDEMGPVQPFQDLAWCQQKHPMLRARAVGAQFMSDDRIALFELTRADGDIKVVEERHYKLVPHSAITQDDLKAYSLNDCQ